MTEPEFGCAGLREVAAELAVGSLSGDERAAAVTHLAGCPGCQQLMGELTGVSESLLLLAPEIEPPPGFESRVLARLGEHGSGRRFRLRSLAAIAAVALLAALGGALTTQLVLDDDPPGLRTAMAISGSGRSTCWVTVTTAEPAALVITLDGSAGRSSEYLAEAQPAQGPAIPLGQFAISDGRGKLEATVGTDGDDLRSVRVFSMDGELLYEAAFPTPGQGS